MLRRLFIVLTLAFSSCSGDAADQKALIWARSSDSSTLDPAEIEFGFDQPSSFEDLESGEQIPVVPSTLAQQYRALVKQHIATLQSRLTENRVDYALMNTRTPLDYALFSFLASRERLVRVR